MGLIRWNVKKRRRVVIAVALLALALSAYPSFVIIYTLSHVARADFKGGHHGPLDAYRHTLASAVVAYTLDERVVEFASRLMESGTRDSHVMDRHNNRIGAMIGSHARSFSEIEQTVRERVADGMVDAPSAQQVTWLPEYAWKEGFVW